VKSYNALHVIGLNTFALLDDVRVVSAIVDSTSYLSDRTRDITF